MLRYIESRFHYLYCVAPCILVVLVCKSIHVVTCILVDLPLFPQSEDPEASALEVTHYQFLGWPDHGVPEYATALIGFIRRVRNGYNPEGPPMLVHCSAGVGRTGTFIVLDTMLERMKKEDSVNVYEVLRDMRLRRAHMVQTQASSLP